MNQGEFYLYSLDGAIDGMDTIKVMGGRFTYENACNKEGTLMLVFPNFSQQPIFVESGASISIKADASHLKEMEITGTDDNELMTDFRKRTNSATPPEALKAAENFIHDNPESYTSVYLLRSYFIENEQADYKKALSLTNYLMEKQPKNNYLVHMKQVIQQLSLTANGEQLPAFTDRDMKGQSVGSASLTSSPVAVISVWASWNYDSQNQQRQLKDYARKYGNRLKIVSICLDANKKDAENMLRNDTISWPNICDGEMFEGKTIRKLGLTSVPDNILLQNGRIKAHSLRWQELKTQLDNLLK